jgi:hypothetical protein
MRTSDSLDIVIPAYKGRFLPALLQSLANQSAKDFSVIVCDDASPEPLEPLCETFLDRLPIRYVRFERNLGATDLAGHWNRSVALSGARWVLLPGDDDALEENCVESFRRTLAACGGKFDLYSFGVRVIDEHDAILRDGIAAAATACAAQYLRQRLADEIYAVPAAHVFRRQAFQALGGFVSFDSGWHSDDATWALLGARGGIQPIEGACIRWRTSPINLTPAMLRDGLRCAQATLAFLSWLLANRSLLALTESDIRHLTDEFLCWPLYAGMADGSPRAWAAAAWRTAGLLRRHSAKSFPRHLLRFARARAARRRASIAPRPTRP